MGRPAAQPWLAVLAVAIIAGGWCRPSVGGVQAAPAPAFVYHHHVHKCGGFAFMACVRNTLGLCGGRAAGGWNCSSYPKRHLPGDYAAIARGEMDFVSAEESWNNDWTRGVPPSLLPPPGDVARARVATMFREPSSRVVSNFLYNTVQHGHRLPPDQQGRAVSVLDSITSSKASGANFMARRSLPQRLYRSLSAAAAARAASANSASSASSASSGDSGADVAAAAVAVGGGDGGQAKPLMFTAADAAAVRRHLQRAFEFVGIMEHYDLSVCLWLTRFAPHKVAVHCNPSDSKPVCPRLNSLTPEAQITDDERAQIHEANHVDNLLYREAQGVFWRAVADATAAHAAFRRYVEGAGHLDMVGFYLDGDDDVSGLEDEGDSDDDDLGDPNDGLQRARRRHRSSTEL